MEKRSSVTQKNFEFATLKVENVSCMNNSTSFLFFINFYPNNANNDIKNKKQNKKQTTYKNKK